MDFQTDKPMAVAEVGRNRFRYLFANEEYGTTIQSAGMDSLRQSAVLVNAQAGPISKNIQNFLTDVVSSRTGKDLTYTVNGQYMQLKANPLASHDQHHLVLLHLTNFTIQKEKDLAGDLDWVIRNMMYLYRHVFLVDTKDDMVIPLVMNSPFRKYLFPKRSGVRELVQEYVETMIHPSDRDRFLAFNDSHSLMERIRKSPEGMISGGFRTLGNDGEYHWDIHSIFPAIRKGKVYLLYTARHFPKANA